MDVTKTTRTISDISQEDLDNVLRELRVQKAILERDLGLNPSEYDKGVCAGVLLAHQFLSQVKGWDVLWYKYYTLHGERRVNE